MAASDVKASLENLRAHRESAPKNMREAFAAVWQVAQDHKVSLRTATFIVACKRILAAREMRGLYP